MNLSGNTAVVTGASRGLGLAISELLVQRGAHVFGLARTLEDLRSAAERLGESFHPVPCDVSLRGEVQKAFREVEDVAGRCDVLVNNAGHGGHGRIEDLDEEKWESMIDVNLRGVVHCTRQAVPVMKRQNERDGFGGHIVNIASIAGLLGNPNISIYNMTKFGVRGFSDALMKEVRDDRIKVTCLYPGSIATDFFAVSGSSGSPGAMEAHDVASTVLHVIETAPNYLISEVVMRPLQPRAGAR